MEHSYLVKPILSKQYDIVAYGDGIYLYDEQGRDYIDGSSGAITVSIGHGVQDIVNEISHQAKKVSFVYRAQFTNQAAEDLARKLQTLAPGDINWSFFVNSGSEATETAIKIVIQYWQEKGYRHKNKILSRKMSYHGFTLGALSMSGHVDRRERFEALLQKYPVLSAPYYYRDASTQSIEACDDMYIAEFKMQIETLGAQNIAAFIAEPFIGAAGAVLIPSKRYFQKIRALCDAYDIIFIADEVMTGFGRTGSMFAMEHFDVIPDIIVTGKGLSAGYTPIAATMINDDIFYTILNTSNMIMTGHTFSSNPLSAKTALSVIEYMEKHYLIEQSAVHGAYLKRALEERQADYKMIGEIRGKGLFIGIEFVENKHTKQSFPPEIKLTDKIVTACYRCGLLVYPANAGENGKDGAAIIIAPPLTITIAEIDILLERFFAALAMVESEWKRGFANEQSS